MTYQSSTDPVARILKSLGPCLTTDLAKALSDELNLSPAAARKRISRTLMSDGEVRRLMPFVFPHRASFVYLQRFFGSDKYWQRLVGLLTENNMAEGFALAALRQRGGIIPISHFAIVCGAPLFRKGHLPPDTVRKRLQSANLLETRDIPGLGTCICIAFGERDPDEQRHEVSARIVAESILLKAVKTWLRNLGIGSYDKISVRDESVEQPRANTFHWDLTAPSYLAPLTQSKRDGRKPGFVVCDVLLGTEINEDGIRPFIRKCQSVRHLENVGKCLQIFVAERYSKKALDVAKRNGVIPATIETLFGSEVAKGLVSLMEVLRNAASYSDPAIFHELFSSLASIEGAATNLRGALFEFIAADLARNAVAPDVEMNRVFEDEKGKAEMDVVAIKRRQFVTFIECKGYQPNATIPDQNIEDWLRKRVPTVYRVARQHTDWKSLSLRFEYWCTGNLSDQSLAMIKKTSKYQIEFKGPVELRNLARSTGQSGLIKTLNEHFLDDQISRAEKTVLRRRRSDQNRVARQLPTDGITTNPEAAITVLSNDDLPF